MVCLPRTPLALFIVAIRQVTLPDGQKNSEPWATHDVPSIKIRPKVSELSREMMDGARTNIIFILSLPIRYDWWVTAILVPWWRCKEFSWNYETLRGQNLRLKVVKICQ